MRTGTYRVYKDNRSEWRWRYISSNGNIIAVSSEGYSSKANCLNSISIMKKSYNDPVYDEDGSQLAA